jgi:hypothetical protein
VRTFVPAKPLKRASIRVRPAEQLGGASSVSFRLPREKLRRLNAIDRVGKLGGDLLVTLERGLTRSPRNGLHHFLRCLLAALSSRARRAGDRPR